MKKWTILQGDARTLPLKDETVDCVITSPPFWGLRDYGVTGQMGLEQTPDAYVAELVTAFREVWRVLKPHGLAWVNLGDSYSGSWGNYHPNSPPGKHGQRLKETARWNRPAYHSQEFLPPTAMIPGLKPKDLCMVPFRAAFALQSDGWWLRSIIPWVKRNPMPESVEDRPGSAIEYVLLLAKSETYYYDHVAVQVPARNTPGGRQTSGSKHRTWASGSASEGQGLDGSGFTASRNRRNSDWFMNAWQGLLSGEEHEPLAFVVNTHGFSDAHFATFPPKLVEPMVKAGTPEKGCCSACGKPWGRIAKKEIEYASGSGKAGNVPHGKYAGTEQAVSGAYDIRMGPSIRTKTLDWQPSCECNAPAVPAVVLDPFAGASTTLLVADRLGRRSIGVELNQDYCHMGYERLRQDMPLFQQVAG